jgi:Flp pilus assembly protein TadD
MDSSKAVNPRARGCSVFYLLMKPVWGVWLGAVLYLSSGNLPLAAQPASGAGGANCLILSAEGKVEVAIKGKTAWAAGTTNQVLHPGDRIRTGLRSRATLRWSDLSVLRVDQLTTMEIAPPEKPGGKAELDLKSGASYLFSREKPSEIQFRTPAGSGAIRGTEFNLAVAENGRTEMTLLDGAVDLKNDRGAITLKGGEQGTVEPNQPPAKTAVVDAMSIIQWALYYPAVVDPDEVGLSTAEKDALSASLQAYRQGDLLQALKSYPDNRPPGSEAERVFHAALLLAVGQVAQAESDLGGVSSASGPANAIREVIAVAKGQHLDNLTEPTSASEYLARSYTMQSRSKLTAALEAAGAATAKSPDFGAAWVRVAELEFGFGRTAKALAALKKGLELSPRNADGLALQGFVMIAAGKNTEGMASFDQAIAADGALANAWLGRGLLKIHNGRIKEGRADLQVAATLEPRRAVLRSYLGKAFADAGDQTHAQKELALAKELDPNDPTAWLYSALLLEEENRVNEAASDLEHSKDLNRNRSVFRSSLLLDQDQAVRSANLAAIYRDDGMFDVSVQEASRAVSSDYANASAHQFLASSYSYLSDPKYVNLRYETATFSEYLMANLLAPPGGGELAQNISQQEYSRLFNTDHLGFYSDSLYASHGDYSETASQYGVVGNTSYSLNGLFDSQRGYRPNNGLTNWTFSAQLRQQLTPQDSLYFEASSYDQKSGDLAQYYNQSQASQTEGVTERQTPNLIAGYHHEWAPGLHTLALAGRFDDTLTIGDTAPNLLFLRTFDNIFTGTTNTSVINPPFYSLNYERKLTAYDAELQQFWQTDQQTLIVGGRYQYATFETESDLDRNFVGTTPITRQSVDPHLNRYSAYAYDYWQVLDPLQLTGGVVYDRLHYPQNIDTSPITSDEATTSRVSPKAGFVWTPWKDTAFRGIYSRSLGGESLDSSVRLEPTQIGGFNQAYRSLIPESVEGLVPGTRFETFGLGWDQKFDTRTYLVLNGQLLKSYAGRTVGVLTNSNIFAPIADSPSSAHQSLNYQEHSLSLSLNQLAGDCFAFGARYVLTEAELDGQFTDIPTAAPGVPNQDVAATLHQVWLYGIFNHPCGWFAELDGVWSSQSNHGYAGTEPGDHFWQLDLFGGYRLWHRRVEARVGVLNVTDRNYQLNPLTLYNELPRERTFVAELKLFF